MKCEFRKGDVIIRVDARSLYVVADAHTDRYSLLYLTGGYVIRRTMFKSYIDKNYVKVDKCNSDHYSEVIDKIEDIWYNLSKGETR